MPEPIPVPRPDHAPERSTLIVNDWENQKRLILERASQHNTTKQLQSQESATGPEEDRISLNPDLQP